MTPLSSLPKGMFGPCWTSEPIATLDERRSPENVCAVYLSDDRGRVRTRMGRLVRLANGQLMDFFRTGVLAAALGCRPQCIYNWEATLGFPRPFWTILRTDGTPFKSRLYERKQLFAIQRLHHQFHYLRGPFRERVADFVAAVSFVFERVPWLPIPEVTNEVADAVVVYRDWRPGGTELGLLSQAREPSAAE
jgi:hypothetical protein